MSSAKEVALHFERAYACHQAGDLASAQAGYQAVLQAQPDHFDAMHMLGVAALQAGAFEQAASLIERALQLQQGYPLAWLNLAGAYRSLGRAGDAADCLARKIALAGEDAATLEALADLCLAAGRWGDAQRHFARVLQGNPRSSNAATGLGIAQLELGGAAEALSSFERALSIEPEHRRATLQLGITLCEQRRHAEALACFDRLLTGEPTWAPAHNARAFALWQLGQMDEAERAYARAIELDPAYAEAYSNRGALLAARGRSEAALSDYMRAIALAPRHAEAHNRLGVLLASLHRNDEAIGHYRQALVCKPDFAQAHNNLGVLQAAMGRVQEAMASYGQAIDLPAASAQTRADALGNRSNLLARLRRYREAAADARAALATDPDHPYTQGDALYFELMQCDWRQHADKVAELEARIAQGQAVATPFVALAVCASPALQLTCARSYATAQFAPHDEAPARPPLKDRIRIAFVGSDFHEHATAYLIAGVIEHIDRRRFELFGLSYGPTTEDHYQQRLKNAFDSFIAIHGHSDAQTAQLIRELDIDIAVDLKGFTNGARPGIFSHRTAPVQVSYLGYPGTTGMANIDYLIADRLTVPVEHEAHYSECIARLPHCCQCSDASRAISTRVFTRSELGLPDEGFVFCSFNNNYKITPEVFNIWMRLLQQVDGSVLWLFQENAEVAGNLRREAGARGVAADRLIFAARLPVAEHLARHCCADLFLDTWPVNAHTTASDALWAGLPMVTCLGSAFAGRVAASLLHAIGLPECVADDAAGYEALALALARDASRLATVRNVVLQAREGAVLFDTPGYARHIEMAFEQMHARAIDGLPPATFDVAIGA